MNPTDHTLPRAAYAPDPRLSASQSAPRAARPGRWSRRAVAIARFTFREIVRRRILSEAGAVAFFLLLAVPPGMSAFANLYGLVADPATMLRHISVFFALIPSSAVGVVQEQVERLALADRGALSLSFAISLGISLLSASAAIRALVDSLNVIFGVVESRGFLRLVGLTVLLALAVELFLLASVALVVALPLGIELLGIQAYAPTALFVLRWPMLLILSAIGMTMTLRYGPCRAVTRWRHTITAGGVASLLWIGMSFAFDSVFRALVGAGKGDESLGAIVAFMTWLWLSAAIFLTCARFVPHRHPTSGLGPSARAA